MKLFIVLIFITSLSSHSQSSLKFDTGDSILFNLKSHSCYSDDGLKQLLFVRTGDCVEITKIYIGPNEKIPIISDRLNLNWNFLKDTLAMKLKKIYRMKEEFSTDKALLYVLNNGKPVTIKLKTLKVVEKSQNSLSNCIYEGHEAHIYFDEFYTSLVKGFKTNVKASCNYKPKQKLPLQGEN
ncbi:MAG: hypothetical protein H7329_05785 [Opitutaceae bacterium]|nr:hypothetical protein [Cytophagales bacterium]